MPSAGRHPAREAAHEAAGCFDFGGIAVSLASASRPWRVLARERYGQFTTDAPPVWRAVYEVTDPQLPEPRFLCDSRREPMRSRRDGARLHLETGTFDMELDHTAGTVALAGPLATYPIDRLIQTLWYETWDRGLIVHAAALAEGRSGWLMSGPSGAGKSTLAALFPERALCDEFVAVRLPSEEAPARLGALPFWRSHRGGADLEGIYMLRHGRRDRRRRLGAGEAFARLRREVVWPTFDGEALRRAFDSLFELLASVPVWELAFRPRTDVWDVICREPMAEERAA